MKERNFDINYDYKNYFPDFLLYGINLNKDEVDWWEFNKILDAILNNENSNMYKVISYRTYEKPSKSPQVREEKEHKYRMEMKRKHALPDTNNTDNGFEKLWNYVEKKVGETKE